MSSDHLEYLFVFCKGNGRDSDRAQKDYPRVAVNMCQLRKVEGNWTTIVEDGVFHIGAHYKGANPSDLPQNHYHLMSPSPITAAQAVVVKKSSLKPDPNGLGDQQYGYATYTLSSK